MTTDIGEYELFCNFENENAPNPVPPIFTISGDIIIVENTNPQILNQNSVKRYKRYKKIKYKKRSAHSATILCVIT